MDAFQEFYNDVQEGIFPDDKNIVEIDENQHIEYDCSCENKRIMELSQDVGHRPIIFIRFNPDDYLNYENKITLLQVIQNFSLVQDISRTIWLVCTYG